MKTHLHRALILGTLIGLGLAGGAGAAGGGGGGGGEMPSMSEPTYDPAAEYAKAIIALNAKDYRAAERALQRVVSAVPRNAEAWRMMGVANDGQADLKGARRAYERAVKLEPENVDGHRGLGLALAGLKDPKAQVELDWLTSRAKACGTCGEAGALAAAVSAVSAAIAGTPVAAATPLLFAGPADGDRAYVAAVSLINEARYDEALTALASASEALGPHPDILTYQGYTWRKKGQLDRAEGYYRQALAVAPEHRGATEYYGELKVERGDLQGARVMLARLDAICAYGCAEAEELRRWVDAGRQP